MFYTVLGTAMKPNVAKKWVKIMALAVAIKSTHLDFDQRRSGVASGDWNTGQKLPSHFVKTHCDRTTAPSIARSFPPPTLPIPSRADDDIEETHRHV
jgi:hypothetical protein